MTVKTLEKGDKYCLVFSVKRSKDVKIGRLKKKLKDGFYCYVGNHNENIHKAGDILFLRFVKAKSKIHKNMEKLSEKAIKVDSPSNGHLHYFSDNPLFKIEFHDAINV